MPERLSGHYRCCVWLFRRCGVVDHPALELGKLDSLRLYGAVLLRHDLQQPVNAGLGTLQAGA